MIHSEREAIAAISAAYQSAFSVLVSELELRGALDGERLISRLEALEASARNSGVPAQENIATILASLIEILNHGRPRVWTPSIVQTQPPDDPQSSQE